METSKLIGRAKSTACRPATPNYVSNGRSPRANGWLPTPRRRTTGFLFAT